MLSPGRRSPLCKMAASMSVRARGIGGPASADVSRCWLGLENEGETGWLDETKEVEEEDSHLDLQEIRNRVERMRREVRNRRKILIKSLPLDITNQEVHNLLAEYELKYCFVDKYKGTAYVTLLNGEQAEDAIHRFHQTRLRDRELSVQLQPTDALLCIANLPHSYTQQQFEDLVRPFGNLERCFLVYNEVTGNPKGYGFVEYMKKDSASRAKSDLFGRQLGTRTLYVHWSDVSQLSYELLHSHCLCVEQLVECETGVLKEAFSKVCQPSFCQLAYGQDGQFKGFAVVEYDSKEVTEIVQQKMNGSIVAGSRVRVSFCAPGPRGRSMLAALIAAQATALNRGKGLLPEPNILQILSSLGSSATLQLLLNPLLHGTSGNKQGILGAAPNVPLLANPALSAALLQLVLQNQTAQKPGILGDSPLAALYGALGLSPQITPPPGKQLLPDLGIGGSLAPVGLPSDLAAATAQLFSGPLGSEWDSPPQTPILGSILSGLQKPSEQGVSLLGEPPRDGNSGHFMSYHAKIPSTGSLGSSNKQVPYKPKPLGNRNHPLSMQDSMLTPSDSYQFEYPQELPPQRYSQNRDHTVPTMGTYESRPKLSPSSRFHERSSNIPAPLPPFSSGSPTSYFTSGLQAGFQQTNLKAVGMPPSSPGGVMLGYEDRSPNAENAYKTPIGAQKRGFSHLIPSPEPSPEGGYVGQHSQGLGGHYADSYLKRKRIF